LEQRVAASNPVVPTIFIICKQFFGPLDWNPGEERDHREKNPSPVNLIV